MTVTLPPRLLLFDDAQGRRGFRPLSQTRPLGELLFGCLLLRERTERALGVECAGVLTDPALRGFEEPGTPPVLAECPTDGHRVILTSRAVLDPVDMDALPREPATVTINGEPIGWICPDGASPPDPSWLLEPAQAPDGGTRVEVSGHVLGTVWEAMAANADRVASDIERMAPDREHIPESVVVLGGHRVSLAADARVEPGVVLDVSQGPIRIERGATVQAFTRLAGPAWIGPGCVVFGGSLGRVSLGPVCKVRGEIEESVVLGFSNKAHDGFLGHAYLGRWVNLGAGTTNSDLKNNYGPVRVRFADGDLDTGQAKVGCFLGDHVKTGIGTFLNTGTVIGAGSNLFGGVMPPKYVPPFSWGRGAELGTYDWDRFQQVAHTVMARRGQELPEGTARVLRELWTRTASLRGADGA